MAWLLVVVLFFLGALCERVELWDAVSVPSTAGVEATADTSIPVADDIGAVSLDPAAATSATTGSAHATLCESAMGASTAGASVAVICGIGAA